MTTELWLLFLSLPLYGLYLGAQSAALRAAHGINFAGTSRDNPPPKSLIEGRADRALANFHETWPVFIILTLIGHLAMPGDALLFWGAIVWGVARLAFLPLYLMGTYAIRSFSWLISLAGLCMMVWAVLF